MEQGDWLLVEWRRERRLPSVCVVTNPARGAWRPLLKAFALADAAPVPMRAFAMRLYRAALYAEAV